MLYLSKISTTLPSPAENKYLAKIMRQCSITWDVELPRPDARGPPKGPRAEVPRCFTSQVIPFYTNLRPRSGLRGCEAASRACKSITALLARAVMPHLKSITARQARDKRYKMPITEQFSYRNTHRDRGLGGNLSADVPFCPRHCESLWTTQSTSVEMGA